MIKNFIKSIYLKLLIRNYHSNISNKAPKVLVSYLPFPLRWSSQDPRLWAHQNRLESIEIVKIFNELGYNVDVIFYQKKILKYKNYNVIFGLEPNFELFSIKNPNAIKIYYATGSYWKFQNDAERQRCKEISDKKDGRLRPSRIVGEHASCELSDWIIQIGSVNTVNTYPTEIRNKIITIRQSSIMLPDNTSDVNLSVKHINNYVWFASNAAALRGLDLCLEYFSEAPQLNLYIIGNVENDFKQLYKKELTHTQNIFYMGWMDVRSSDYINIVSSCTFAILPSASEGFPGSILTLLNLGIIPIISINAFYPGFEKFSILIKQINYKSLTRAIEESRNLSDNEIKLRSILAKKFVKDNFSIESYRNDFKNAINFILENPKN